MSSTNDCDRCVVEWKFISPLAIISQRIFGNAERSLGHHTYNSDADRLTWRQSAMTGFITRYRESRRAVRFSLSQWRTSNYVRNAKMHLAKRFFSASFWYLLSQQPIDGLMFGHTFDNTAPRWYLGENSSVIFQKLVNDIW